MQTTQHLTEELSTERLEAELVDLAQRLAAGTYELLRLVGEYDARGAWVSWGALSCVAWLADLCDIERATAASYVRVARVMRRFAALDRAIREQSVSYAKGRVLAAHLTAENCDELIAIATVTPAGRLGAAIARWSRAHHDPDTIDARHHDQRSMTARTDADGMVTITARLPPLQGAAAVAVIDAHLATNAPAGAFEPLHRQRADALFDAIAGGGGTVDTELVIHVRGRDAMLLTDGTAVSEHAVMHLLDRAFISLLVHDMNGHPIDASPRRRVPTRRQRRLLEELHPTCARAGCDAARFLQADHIRRRSDGGPTVIANLRLLCGPHNREREAWRN
jgi:Domain of unknown function (DUF222)